MKLQPAGTERVHALERRLAATDARLTALVQVMSEYWASVIETPEYRTRLATLRAPGEEVRDGDFGDRLEISAAMQDAGVGGRTILDGVRELITALATARRARVGRGRK